MARLVCPDNLLGQADVYLITHHANNESTTAVTLAALKPRVAIANNGAYKGGAPPTWTALHGHPEIAVWQLHKSLNYDSVNYPDEFIANPEFGANDRGAWIKASANGDGSFSVTNGRTGWSRPYGRN